MWHSCFSFSLQGFVTLTRAQPPQRIAANPPPQVKHPSEHDTIHTASCHHHTDQSWYWSLLKHRCYYLHRGSILAFQLIPLHRTKEIVHLKMTIVLIYSLSCCSKPVLTGFPLGKELQLYTAIRRFGGQWELILFFSKDALNLSKVTVTLLQKISIFNCQE